MATLQDMFNNKPSPNKAAAAKLLIKNHHQVVDLLQNSISEDVSNVRDMINDILPGGVNQAIEHLNTQDWGFFAKNTSARDHLLVSQNAFKHMIPQVKAGYGQVRFFSSDVKRPEASNTPISPKPDGPKR